MKNIVNRIPNSRPDQRNDERRFPPREKQYRGYTVEVPPGGDAVRAYRKIKKMLKDNKVFEEMRERESFTPRSAKRRLARKEALMIKRRATKKWIEETNPWLNKRKK
jgi:ribosomal protein S21